MTDQDQTAVEQPADPAVAAQEAPAEAPAPEVAAEPDAAPAAPEAPAAVAEAPAPDAPAPDAPDAPEDFEIDITETIVIHNPAALRGIAAGPADHPRVLAARAAAEQG